jgi:hypothetical protein
MAEDKPSSVTAWSTTGTLVTPSTDSLTFIHFHDGIVGGSGSDVLVDGNAYLTQFVNVSWPSWEGGSTETERQVFNYELNVDRGEEEAAAAELLAETDLALEAIARGGDRIDSLLEQIKAVRAETVV